MASLDWHVWLSVLVFGSALAVGACEAAPDPDTAFVQGAVVSGTDDCSEAYQLSGPTARNADGVALMTYTSALPPAHDGVVDLPVQTFASGYLVCPTARFASQPLANAGHCTAYLVSPRLVATAGHCTNYDPVGTDETQLTFVFGFQMTSATSARTTIPVADVYRGARVAALCENNNDCTLIELERPVTNHRILPIRRTGVLPTTDLVYALGHPFLLPLKYDGPVPLWQVIPEVSLIFSQQLDIAGGNSGSPLFNATTHEVEGTVGGKSQSGDFGDLVTTSAGCNVEYQVQPEDNYTSYSLMVSQYAAAVPAYCSGDVGGWSACGASGCGVCAAMIDTAKYSLYFQNHPNCTLDAACAGAVTACSAACPAPTATDSPAAPETPLSRVGWTAKASSTSGADVPARALDGLSSTRWSTGASQVNGQWFLVDMKATRAFDQVTLDAAANAADTPRGYQVSVSADGVTFGAPIASGQGAGSLVTINFPPQNARYLKIVQTGTASKWWSIAELNVNVGGTAAPAPTRLNAGGPTVAPYLADFGATGGNVIIHANPIDLSSVTSPAPTAVYQTARVGKFSYTVPGFTAGSGHTVRLHFAETYFSSAGARVFHVKLNGAQVLTSFDVFAAAGAKNKAVTRSFIAVADASGSVTIQTAVVTDHPLLSAIEIQ